MKLILLLLFVPIMLFGGIVTVNVKGLICPSCAIGIKKHLDKTKKVKSIKLDIEKQQTIITELKNKTITDKEIQIA